jgi:hypothetical protein
MRLAWRDSLLRRQRTDRQYPFSPLRNAIDRYSYDVAIGQPAIVAYTEV